MSSLLLIILSAVLISIIAASDEHRGLRPFANESDLYRNAFGLAQAHLIAVPVICGLTWALSYGVLRPLDLLYLRTPTFAALLLITVAMIELFMRHSSALKPSRPAFALVMCANGAMLGIALMSDVRASSLWGALLLGIGASLVFALLLLCAATLYERLRYADVPAPFKRAPILLICVGMMALAFMGFSGLIQE
jgi:electron transport complex protein RnfA